MVATTKRHPSRTRIKTAVTKEGKLLGAEIDFAIDGGAYATLSSVVLSRGTIPRRRTSYIWPELARSQALPLPPTRPRTELSAALAPRKVFSPWNAISTK